MANLNRMEKLELYNIGQPDREVFPLAKVPTYRSSIIESLLRRGLIVENERPGQADNGGVYKAFRLTPAGEEVYPHIILDAQAIVARFRRRRERGLNG